MSDIVEQLRTVDTQKMDAWAICDEAADEIERLWKAIRIAYGIIDECSPHRLKELNDVVVREGK